MNRIRRRYSSQIKCVAPKIQHMILRKKQVAWRDQFVDPLAEKPRWPRTQMTFPHMHPNILLCCWPDLLCSCSSFFCRYGASTSRDTSAKVRKSSFRFHISNAACHELAAGSISYTLCTVSLLCSPSGLFDTNIKTQEALGMLPFFLILWWLRTTLLNAMRSDASHCAIYN